MHVQKLDFYIEDSAGLFAYVANEHWAQFLDSGKRVDGAPSLTREVDTMVFSPQIKLITKKEKTAIHVSGNEVEYSDESPFHIVSKTIESYKEKFRTNDVSQHGLDVPFCGGAIGYFGYELGRHIETLPCLAIDDLDLPDMAIGIYEVAIVTCHTKQETWLIDATGENRQLRSQWLNQVEQYWKSKNSNNKVQDQPKPWRAVSELQENINRDEYQGKFDQIKQYLYEGDAYQINLAKRFNVKIVGDAWSSYLRMRQLSPAPFGAYMNFPFATILSNSPEQFIECSAQSVKTSPIKGTRPRDKEVLEHDIALAKELKNSIKDQAENVMIVDLLRNDLGKICEIGSIDVPQLFAIESFTNVHHLVSQITGQLQIEKNALDLLESSFPGGSITGAPKKRAMEIIDELEPHCRGVYCGAIGSIDFVGNMKTNIAIRTITNKQDVAYFSAGGGVVMDSDCDEEYQEIMDKAAVMLSIVGVKK